MRFEGKENIRLLRSEMLPIDLPERFRRRIKISESGCWLWRHPLSQDGYGQIFWQGQMRGAHRVVWMLLRGNPIGELDHTCRVRNCVNPDHLEIVSHRENTLRGNTIPAAFAKRDKCKHGHPFTPENTTMVGNTRRCLICRRRWAREYLRRKNGIPEDRYRKRNHVAD